MNTVTPPKFRKAWKVRRKAVKWTVAQPRHKVWILEMTGVDNGLTGPMRVLYELQTYGNTPVEMWNNSQVFEFKAEGSPWHSKGYPIADYHNQYLKDRCEELIVETYKEYKTIK